MDLVNTKPMLKRTLIACGVQAFGQVSPSRLFGPNSILKSCDSSLVSM
jgi:hypothetical protein